MSLVGNTQTGLEVGNSTYESGESPVKKQGAEDGHHFTLTVHSGNGCRAVFYPIYYPRESLAAMMAGTFSRNKEEMKWFR